MSTETLLKKSIVLYSANVYLELIPNGSRVSASSEVNFPLETRHERVFHFSVGQMAGQTPDEADFEKVAEVALDQLPVSPDGHVDLRVHVDIDSGKKLYVRLDFKPDGAFNRQLGPFVVN